MTVKRRSLVLTDESARHPFRMSLPPHVRQQNTDKESTPLYRLIDGKDWRSFFSAYCAAFVAVTIFIA